MGWRRWLLGLTGIVLAWSVAQASEPCTEDKNGEPCASKKCDASGNCEVLVQEEAPTPAPKTPTPVPPAGVCTVEALERAAVYGEWGTAQGQCFSRGSRALISEKERLQDLAAYGESCPISPWLESVAAHGELRVELPFKEGAIKLKNCIEHQLALVRNQELKQEFQALIDAELQAHRCGSWTELEQAAGQFSKTTISCLEELGREKPTLLAQSLRLRIVDAQRKGNIAELERLLPRYLKEAGQDEPAICLLWAQLLYNENRHEGVIFWSERALERRELLSPEQLLSCYALRTMAAVRIWGEAEKEPYEEEQQRKAIKYRKIAAVYVVEWSNYANAMGNSDHIKWSHQQCESIDKGLCS